MGSPLTTVGRRWRDMAHGSLLRWKRAAIPDAPSWNLGWATHMYEAPSICLTPGLYGCPRCLLV